MVSAIDSALSGLAASSRRIAVSANNVANQFSTQSRVDGQVTNTPYTPQRVDTISQVTGGVKTQVRDVPHPVIRAYDPDNVAADETGFVDTPNVDVAEEMIKQRIASYDYKANLKTIQINNNLEKNLLDIIS